GQKVIGYRVSRQMQVKVRELDRLGEVLDGIVGAGANEVFGAQMSTADPSAAEHAALESAMAAARAKAEVLAAAAGVKLGRVARIEEDVDGGGMPMPKMRMMGAMAAEAADAGTEVATGDLTVTRSIRAWFELA
ncbi:MAG: SIMPL domain-containing protein, partial [Chloroflexota bacterium]|nr:SIMPL domain-containing protein [Chloroflexota bacterium]